VSDKALSCPHCGIPMQSLESNGNQEALEWLLPLILIGILLLGILFFFIGG